MLLLLLLLLEHHSRILAILARVKLLRARRRGLPEVPAATAGRRGCHHGVDVLLTLLGLGGNDTGANYFGQRLPYHHSV